MRNIQVDLKYKFLLVTDVAWLVIDVFAFTLLGGMVDSATEVTYSMDVNVDMMVNETLDIYIYDVDGNYFYASDHNITIMEHKTRDEFDSIEGLKKYPDLNISINGHGLLDWTDNETLRYQHPALTFNGKLFTVVLDEISDFLDNTTYENQVEIRYEHKGDKKDRINENEYFAYDSFYYLPVNATVDGDMLIADSMIDSVMGEEGLIIHVTDQRGNDVVNASVFIDGEFEGKTDEMGNFSWEDAGGEIIHFRDKGIHSYRIKQNMDNSTIFARGEFLIGSPKNRMGIDYDLRNFFLVGVLFWAFFGKAYEDTVNTIPEEASRGTIGFLVTNNVNISTLLISRNIASSIKTFVMTMTCIIPPFLILGVFDGFDIADLPLLLLVFGLMWLFMLVISMFISSLNIIFKKITPAAMMIMYGLKVLTGYYFPLEALDEYVPGLSDKIKIIPLVRGSYFIRDVIIIGKDPSEALSTIQDMIVGTLVLFVVTMILYKVLEYKSQRWGTLEFY